MPIKGGRRTDKEALFIGHLASTGDATFAAVRAGYRDPQVQGWQKAHNPAIVDAVRREQVARLNNSLLPIALDLIERVILDDKENTRNRLTAAKIVVDRTLGQVQDGAESKEPHEMTAAELQARIERLRREQSERARPVIDAEHTPAPGVFD